MRSIFFVDSAGERIKLRSPQKSDTAKLVDFFDSLSKKSKDLFYPHPFNQKSAVKIASNKELIVLATIQVNRLEKIVGYTFIHKIPITGGGNLGIAVADSHTGRGIGKKLTKEILTLAKRGGFAKVCLTVKTKNKNAIALYQKMGFLPFEKNKLIKAWIQIYELIANFGWFFFAQTAIKALLGKKDRQDESWWMVKDLKS